MGRVIRRLCCQPAALPNQRVRQERKKRTIAAFCAILEKIKDFLSEECRSA